MARLMLAVARGGFMKSTARFGGHPIHPMLIPYPFAFLTGAAAFDALAASRRDRELANTARHLGTAGLAAAVVAAVPGLIDYLTAVPDGKPKNTATKHLLSNVTALACFAAAAAGRRENELPSRNAVLCGVIGSVLLGVGGWLGGTLSYHHQVGVEPEERLEDREQRLLAEV
jgi:uncharacterized membrane protein